MHNHNKEMINNPFIQYMDGNTMIFNYNKIKLHSEYVEYDKKFIASRNNSIILISENYENFCKLYDQNNKVYKNFPNKEGNKYYNTKKYKDTGRYPNMNNIIPIITYKSDTQKWNKSEVNIAKDLIIKSFHELRIRINEKIRDNSLDNIYIPLLGILELNESSTEHFIVIRDFLWKEINLLLCDLMKLNNKKNICET